MTQEQFDWLFNKAKELMYKTLDPVHDWAHIERVLANMERIKELLPVEKIKKLDDKILKLAVAWHDISYTQHKDTFTQYLSESWRSIKIIKKYFKEINLNKEEMNLISNIVLHHDWVELFFLRWVVLNKRRSIYHQIVQDADTMDVFSDIRVNQAEENITQSLFKRVVMRILKPLFFNFVVRHKVLVYNLPEIVDRLDKNSKK